VALAMENPASNDPWERAMIGRPFDTLAAAGLLLAGA
jgi:hypothetical protein